MAGKGVMPPGVYKPLEAPKTHENEHVLVPDLGIILTPAEPDAVKVCACMMMGTRAEWMMHGQGMDVQMVWALAHACTRLSIHPCKDVGVQ